MKYSKWYTFRSPRGGEEFLCKSWIEMATCISLGGGGGKCALWNLKSKNPTWLENSKSVNFLLGRGGQVALWTLKSNFPTRLKSSKSANLSLGRGGGRESRVALWNFEIWNPAFQIFTFFISGRGGCKVALFPVWSKVALFCTHFWYMVSVGCFTVVSLGVLVDGIGRAK